MFKALQRPVTRFISPVASKEKHHRFHNNSKRHLTHTVTHETNNNSLKQVSNNINYTFLIKNDVPYLYDTEQYTFYNIILQ